MQGLWKGLFEWSMQYQDGTRPSDGPKEMPESERKWLEDALKARTIDLNERMREIKTKLDGPSGEASLTVQDKEAMLDELMDIVDHIDLARDLQTIGGLPVLLQLLADPEPVLRAKSAEVVATCAQNNEPVQKWMVDNGIFPPLLALLEGDDVACRVKALLALSCLVRENGPALDRLRALGGLARVVVAGATQPGAAPQPRLQRKVLQLLQYWMRERPSDAPDALAQGLVPGLAGALTSDDGDVREAALGVMVQLARVREARTSITEDPQLQSALAGVQALLDGKRGEDADAASEQAAALRALREELDAPPAVSAAAAPAGSGGAVVLVPKKP